LIEKYGVLPENIVKFYLAELVLAIEFLHEHNIIHRDVKPENMLIDNKGHIKLADFGLCKQGITKNEVTRTWCSTPEYMAPEMLEGKGYSCAVDWYQLGLCIYELLLGQLPFYDVKTPRMYNNILKATLNIPDTISKAAQSLIRGLLERDPTKRIGSSAKGAQEIKEHPFFSGINWQQILNMEYDSPFIPLDEPNPNDAENLEDDSMNAESNSDSNGGPLPYLENYYFNYKGDQLPKTESCSCI